MRVLNVQNVNEAVACGFTYLLNYGAEESSRNGKVLVSTDPVCTIYNKPLERVLFSPTRDANPFFHLMESLWMLAGRNDVEFPAQFNKRFKEYSDDGVIAWGAYGHRWRQFFGYDQLAVIIRELRANPTSRRCVLAMWNGMPDELTDTPPDLDVAVKGGKDVPCNTHAYFDVRGGALNMTVCNRSNDAVWGAYGANVVHFGFLLEYMAEQIGVPVGVYRQMSNNFHAYLDHYDRQKLESIVAETSKTNLYKIYPDMQVVPLGSAAEGWHDELMGFFDAEQHTFEHPFFELVAAPMLLAWRHHKDGDAVWAKKSIDTMPYCDWQIAALGWLNKREKKNAA